MIGYGEMFRLLLPEVMLILTALLVLSLDLFRWRDAPREARLRNASVVAALGSFASMVLLVFVDPEVSSAGGILVLNPFVNLVKLFVIGLSIAVCLIASDSRFTKHVGEYFALLLMATLGMCLMISSGNLLVIFLSLETTSLILYILVAFDKSSAASTEAAFKYFVYGGISAAFALFGISYLYGFGGTLEVARLADGLGARAGEPIVLLALVLVLVGFGFKIAVAPFHLWAPDAYQGAPIPAAAWIASGSKIAGFLLFANLLRSGLADQAGGAGWGGFIAGWKPVLAIFALLSMVLGNLAAIAQSNVRRLLAYSAIAHSGYAVIGVIGGDAASLAAMTYYIVTYAAAALGAFAVIGVVERICGGSELSHFAGLSKRSPLLAFTLLVFVLSIAGIPPLPGFFGKFFVFAAALKAGPTLSENLWLVVVAIAMSTVGLYYYLKILKQVFVMEADSGDAPTTPLDWRITLTLIALAAVVVLLGCFPEWLVGRMG